MKEVLILGIHAHNSFIELKEEFKEKRPIVPAYDWNTNNVEEWKANSLRQEGFDLCLAVLNINLKE